MDRTGSQRDIQYNRTAWSLYKLEEVALLLRNRLVGGEQLHHAYLASLGLCIYPVILISITIITY